MDRFSGTGMSQVYAMSTRRILGNNAAAVQPRQPVLQIGVSRHPSSRERHSAFYLLDEHVSVFNVAG